MLALAVIGAAPRKSSALTEGDYEYTVYAGWATVTGYTGSGGDIVIPATLGGCPVRYIGTGAFLNNKKLTSVVIPDTVTHIMGSIYWQGVSSYNKGAFAGCTNIKSVTLPANLREIQGYAFRECQSLKTVVFRNTWLPGGFDNPLLWAGAFQVVEAHSSYALWTAPALDRLYVARGTASYIAPFFRFTSGGKIIEAGDCNKHYEDESGFILNAHAVAICGQHYACDANFSPPEHWAAPCGNHYFCMDGYVSSEHTTGACGNHYRCAPGFFAGDHESKGQCDDHFACEEDYWLTSHNLSPNCMRHFICDGGDHRPTACGNGYYCDGSIHQPACYWHCTCQGGDHSLQPCIWRHYKCENDGLDHSPASCGDPDHYNCHGGDAYHATTAACGKHLHCATGDHRAALCGNPAHFRCDGANHGGSMPCGNPAHFACDGANHNAAPCGNPEHVGCDGGNHGNAECGLAYHSNCWQGEHGHGAAACGIAGHWICDDTHICYILGDANCDGSVDAADAAAILRHLAGLGTLSAQGLINANVNGDSEVDAADAAAILRSLAGLGSLTTP